MVSSSTDMETAGFLGCDSGPGLCPASPSGLGDTSDQVQVTRSGSLGCHDAMMPPTKRWQGWAVRPWIRVVKGGSLRAPALTPLCPQWP